MRKFIVLVLFLFPAFIFLASYSGDSIQQTFANVAPTATPAPNSPNKNISVRFDKDSVSPKCPPGYRRMSGRTCGDGMLIMVTVAVESENDALIYKYGVSGGRIIGEGATVTWDLTGAQPGTYTITIDAEDKAKMQSQTEARTVTVFDDCCHGDCFCPDVSVAAPTSPTQPGEAMTFTANVSGGSADDVTYNWTVSKGKIIEGQGTPAIRVATDLKMAGSVVKATINFGGNAFCGDVCVTTFSAEGFVAAEKGKKK